MNSTFALFFVLFAAKCVFACLSICASLRFLRYGAEDKVFDAQDVSVFIIVPLLREQSRLARLFERMHLILHECESITFVLVTTERENMEFGDGKEPTSSLVRDMIARSSHADRILHRHYPHNNRLLAEQLNFAVDEVKRLFNSGTGFLLFAFYNADSHYSIAAINYCISLATGSRNVVQQSSFFLRNFNNLIAARSYVAAADAVYQSRWTIQHELPRLLTSAIPSTDWRYFFTRYSFANCVGHGLFIGSNLLDEVGGIPEPRVGLEDSALGFILRGRGFPILPCPHLEDSDAANSISTLFRQKRSWILGPLGALEYRRMALPCCIDSRQLRALNLLVAQSLWNGIKWGVSGPFVVLFIVLGAKLGGWPLVSAAALYSLYCYIPFVVVFYLARGSQSKSFSEIRMSSIALCAVPYLFLPILNSVFGIAGFVLWAKLHLSGSLFRQKKTET